ncbi:MAG: UDP-galactopyranose mutase [Candidatus Margulisbacteria bacterium]|nr:UDP-galactopyranose mutase [Candidatus Margulisiibacteriota bacterium]
MAADCLVVGLGFAGAVVAERLASAGKKVRAIDQRGHLGGNCYDCLDETGILVQKYGPHIFHTDNATVWNYLSQFTEWLPYEHKVQANVGGKKVSLPVNLNSLDQLFSENEAKTIAAKLIETFGPGAKVSIMQLRQSADHDLKKVADEIYQKIFHNYTKKQWGVPPEELDPAIIERVPLWTDRDERYFKDKFQGIPRHGYTKMFERLLGHPNIEVVLNEEFKPANSQDYEQIVYTGPIDDYFNHQHGRLPYRSLSFYFEKIGQPWYQEVAVVNFPGTEGFTRVTEFKHLTGQEHEATAIVREYPEEHLPEKNIPSYPIMNEASRAQYQKYQAEAAKLENVAFVGRLAEFKYYDMDDVVERGLSVARNI